jgi:hypothetical protein
MGISGLVIGIKTPPLIAMDPTDSWRPERRKGCHHAADFVVTRPGGSGNRGVFPVGRGGPEPPPRIKDLASHHGSHNRSQQALRETWSGGVRQGDTSPHRYHGTIRSDSG